MPDPLSSESSSRFRSTLALVRELEGSTISAAELGDKIPGWGVFGGIYKPAGSEYALWVRQTREGPYPDKEPIFHPDGSWTYRYSPERQEGKPDASLSSNRGLIRCMSDRVPIAVFRQSDNVSGRRTYRVLGLGYVDSQEAEHFVIRGEPIDETARPLPDGVIPPFAKFEFSPIPVEEVVRKLRERRFSSVIRELYHEKCSLCQIGYRIRGQSLALEAAHIIPVKHNGILGDIRNGLLLCSNHHALFDGYAWTFDTEYRVVVTSDEEFRRSALANHLLGWEDKPLPNLPTSPGNYPAPEAIEWRMTEFEKRQQA
jgi:putative restriction endonuclease